LVEFAGSKDNNIVYGGSLCRWGFQGHSLFVDPSAPPSERYKLVYQAELQPDILEPPAPAEAAKRGNAGAKQRPVQSLLSGVSADGIHWKENPRPLLTHIKDGQNTIYYDPTLKRYVGYFRSSILGRRGVRRSETADFGNWPRPEPILQPNPGDDPADDYCENTEALYPGTRAQHLMFITVNKGATDSSTLRLAVSADGKIFNAVPGGDLMTPGPDGAWDGGYFFMGAGLTELPGEPGEPGERVEQVALPFVASRLPQKFPRITRLGAVGLAMWPRERLAALLADSEGEFFTPILSVAGDALYLNFRTRRAGYVKVEVADTEGRALADCDPLIGDQLKAKVTWKGQSSIDPAARQRLRLHFRLRAARIYSFEFK
jgi:hypothetical protein